MRVGHSVGMSGNTNSVVMLEKGTIQNKFMCMLVVCHAWIFNGYCFKYPLQKCKPAGRFRRVAACRACRYTAGARYLAKILQGQTAQAQQYTSSFKHLSRYREAQNQRMRRVNVFLFVGYIQVRSTLRKSVPSILLTLNFAKFIRQVAHLRPKFKLTFSELSWSSVIFTRRILIFTSSSSM
jgi:hypothetical protein